MSAEPAPADGGARAAEVATAVAAVEADLVALRRDLHAHPEPSWEETRTTEVVGRALTDAGLEVRAAPTATGLLCDVGSGDAVVALRADLDALRLTDVKEVPYRSTVPGVAHACGHDLHTAAAVGAALALARTLRPGEGRVRLVFQPAEETIPSGARPLAEAGVVDGARAAFALHCDPRLEVGQVGVSPGPITSAADQVEIRLAGPGGHTGRPHRTVDLVHVAARMVVDLQASLDRLTDPRDSVNLTFGAVASGDAANVIPSEAVLRGSLRAGGRAGWEDAARLLPGLVAGVAEPLGATWELDHRTGAPPVENDPWATRLLGAAAAHVARPGGVVPTRQSGGGEDFSWFLERVPGAFARLGTTPPGAEPVDIHSGAFDVDERAIALGARLLAGVALAALAAP
ncbi:amidohydrolase [Iamia majanohamensis]|uniref:Amidohydrolase n=1 Tax=Iamia majanohamensis TaxID=467976 RepID=A0AAE9Y905_9ACTN|nr:amidohydrolase [Iamia majanohamensis]WCO68985.1 amidohydrolase [Iamia majanohamensis]